MITIKVLVTGASGHIGYHICKLLVSEGFNVRAFIRPTSYKDHLEKLPIDIYYGDIFKVDSLERTMKGIDSVFHAAAIYKLTEPKTDTPLISNDPIILTAIQGTKNLYKIAADNNVKKIVYTSSVETVGFSYNKKKPLDETSFAKDAFYVYTKAKIDSERLAIELAKKFSLPTVICNPSTVIGKYDYKLTPSNSMILNFARNSSFYVDGGQSLVDIEDVARGHLDALAKGRNMERYILSGENIEIKDLIIMIRDILNKKGPFIKLNKTVLYPAALFFEMLSAITKKPSFFTRRKVLKIIGSYSFYDNSKARKELGYNTRNLKDTLPLTLRWLLERYT